VVLINSEGPPNEWYMGYFRSNFRPPVSGISESLPSNGKMISFFGSSSSLSSCTEICSNSGKLPFIARKKSAQVLGEVIITCSSESLHRLLPKRSINLVRVGSVTETQERLNYRSAGSLSAADNGSKSASEGYSSSSKPGPTSSFWR
jgi:hypothetical protein